MTVAGEIPLQDWDLSQYKKGLKGLIYPPVFLLCKHTGQRSHLCHAWSLLAVWTPRPPFLGTENFSPLQIIGLMYFYYHCLDRLKHSDYITYIYHFALVCATSPTSENKKKLRLHISETPAAGQVWAYCRLNQYLWTDSLNEKIKYIVFLVLLTQQPAEPLVCCWGSTNIC